MIVGSIMLGPGMLPLLVGYYVGVPYRRTVYSTHVEFQVSATEAARTGVFLTKKEAIDHISWSGGKVFQVSDTGELVCCIEGTGRGRLVERAAGVAS